MGVVVRRYIDFLLLLIPTPLVSVLFCSSIPTFCSFLKMFFIWYIGLRLGFTIQIKSYMDHSLRAYHRVSRLNK